MTAPLSYEVTNPYYQDDHVTLHLGENRKVLPRLPDCSVHAVVTDPPYGIGFMGHEWDQPGEYAALSAGHGGSNISYGGAPHPAMEAGRYDLSRYDLSRSANARFGLWCEAWSRECFRILKPGGHIVSFGGSRTWHRLQTGIEDAGFEIRDSIAWLFGSGFPKSHNLTGDWDGWGTALKPAFEPIVVGRKPLIGTVAANVADHGTGAIHIAACRTATDGEVLHRSTSFNDMRGGHYGSGHRPGEASAERRYTDQGGTNFAAIPGARDDDRGRWPTNVVLDESQAAELDRQSGILTSGANPTRRGSDKFRNAYGDFTGQEECTPARGANSGGASRFFPTFHYEAKASSAERPVGDDGTVHPTVKPLDLMRWLVRLVTPAGGTVLDPFFGSGTTGEACVIEGVQCIGIERHKHNGQTCGSCVHRVLTGHHNRTYPKCDLTAMSFSAASDCRAWWPACPKWALR